MDEQLKAQSERYTATLTDNLIELVREKGFKTTVIADEIGIGQATMSRYINHVREMPMSVVTAICSYAGLDPARLIQATYDQLERGAAQAMLEQAKKGTFDLAALENSDKNTRSEYDTDSGS